MGYAGDRHHREVIERHNVRLERARLRITLPMNPWVFRFWLFVIAWNVSLSMIALRSNPLSATPVLFYLALLISIGAAYFAVRAWSNATVFAFDAQTFSATFGPLAPNTTFAMPIADIVRFRAEHSEDREAGFILTIEDQAGTQTRVPARLHGVVLSLRGSKKQRTGKPDDALVIALAKELNGMLFEHRKRQEAP